MNISILIATWNNASVLTRTLKALTQCQIPGGLAWEVVLVNNNCTDATDQVAQRFASELPLNYIKEPAQGLSHARNTGISACRGSLIIFTDDDVTPCPEWIEVYWQAFQAQPNGYFWGGPVSSAFEDKTALDPDLLALAPFCIQGLWWGPTQKVLGKNEELVSANWAAPLKLIKEMHGFNASLGLNPAANKPRTGEETDLMQRLMASGLQALYLPKAQLAHYVPVAKCTRHHIMAKAEGSGYYYGNKIFKRGEAICWGGVPRWMFRAYGLKWLHYWALRLKGHKAYAKEKALRHFKGMIDGIRDQHQ